MVLEGLVHGCLAPCAWAEHMVSGACEWGVCLPHARQEAKMSQKGAKDKYP
jgi:hypothetical protein